MTGATVHGTVWTQTSRLKTVQITCLSIDTILINHSLDETKHGCTVGKKNTQPRVNRNTDGVCTERGNELMQRYRFKRELS